MEYKFLSKEETVHHINFNKSDNQLINLYLFPTKHAHQEYHWYQHKTSPISQSNLSMNG